MWLSLWTGTKALNNWIQMQLRRNIWLLAQCTCVKATDPNQGVGNARPGQVQLCHGDQVATASPSISMAARGDTPSDKWISLIGSVIYWCFPLRGIIGVWASDWWGACLPLQPQWSVSLPSSKQQSWLIKDLDWTSNMFIWQAIHRWCEKPVLCQGWSHLEL